MMLLLEIAFWFCILNVTFTYGVYPYLIKWLGKKQLPNNLLFSKDEGLPHVAILISVYNEEKIIGQKLQSILKSKYPAELLHIFIGNDLSNDSTAEIINNEKAAFQSFTVYNGTQRSGKPSIVNKLAALAKEKLGNDSIFIITDANVLFHPDMIFELVKNFKNQEIGLVGANVMNDSSKASTVSELETLYISKENDVKYFEGRFHGALMGPFGACFAMRSNLFVEIPPHFIVDDFYLCMQVHNQHKQCIYEKEANCYEDVPGNMWEEFRRKSRIASGNFQNLFFFMKWLFKPFTPVGFTFVAHKILRWFTPFFAICGLLLVAALAVHNSFYAYIFWYKFIFWGFFFLDIVLVAINIHFKPLRLLTYFYFMNVAIIVGFFRFLRGIKTATWNSTRRNVK